MRLPVDFPYAGYESSTITLLVPGRAPGLVLTGAHLWGSNAPKPPDMELHVVLAVPVDLARIAQLPAILQPGASFELRCEQWGRVQKFYECKVLWNEQRPMNRIALNATGRNSVDQVCGIAAAAGGWDET